MVFVRLIRSGLRLPFSDFLRSSIERSFSFSCEKQTGRLDHLPVPGLSCGSLLTGRWFVRLPSDDLCMTPDIESLQVENGKLSTGYIVIGGKLLPKRWISAEFKTGEGLLKILSAGPDLLMGEDGGRPGPLDQSRRLHREEDEAAGIVTFCLKPEPL